jgi:glycosyltransferase involved in cell wall biosynthesis
MRTLHVITSDARRGAETYAVNLAREMAEEGHESRTVALFPSGAAMPLDVPVLGPSRRSPETLRELRREARGADVVVAHGSSTLEASALGLVGTGVPFVYRTIGDPGYWRTSASRERLIGGMLRRARRHVVLWTGAAEQLGRRYGIPTEVIDVIPNAVPGEKFPLATALQRAAARAQLGVGNRAHCLAFVGALSPEKNVAAAIDAALVTPGATLLVVGDGEQRPVLERYARRRAPDRVQFLGTVSEPWPIYAACDLLLLPSRSEGMPAVVIEAGLVGRATVATAVGAVPEMIQDRDTGYVVAVGDDRALRDSVHEGLAGGAEVGQRASERFRDRFTFRDNVRLWSRTFDSL